MWTDDCGTALGKLVSLFLQDVDDFCLSISIFSEPELFTSFSMESSTLNNSFVIDLPKINIASTFYLLCYYVILFLKRH